MSSVDLHIATAERMRTVGRAVGAVAEPGDRFLLEGPFGAGKTTFVQGLAEGLGISTPITSPSFVIETQYRDGRLVLYHVDLYRLNRIEPELLEQLEDHLFGDGVAAVEWAERLPGELRDGAALMCFAEAGNGRRIELHTCDERLITAARQA